MIETHVIYDSAIRAVGAKKVAHALSVSLAWVYRLAQPAIAADPDSNGANRNDLDRIEALVDVLAAHPDGGPVLVLLRSWFTNSIDRGLGEWRPEPLTQSRLSAKTSRCLHEFADFLDECSRGGRGEMDPQKLQREGAEVIDAIERLMRAAAAGIERRETDPRARLLSAIDDGLENGR